MFFGGDGQMNMNMNMGGFYQEDPVSSGKLGRDLHAKLRYSQTPQPSTYTSGR